MRGQTSSKLCDPGEGQVEVAEYRLGLKGYASVETYDAARYEGPANEYKQRVMANAYRKLLGPVQEKRVLDVGCGTGRGVVEFACQAEFAAGVDASLDMLNYAAHKAAGNRRCTFARAYAQRLPFRDNEFDAVVSLNFLHLFTLQTQQTMVAEMKRVVKPGGLLLLEFDNALHGLCVGLYKRWTRREQGSLPGEIRSVIGGGCAVERIYGAVAPVAWRLFYRFPKPFLALEKIEYFPPFNRLAHRIYYKLRKLSP